MMVMRYVAAIHSPGDDDDEIAHIHSPGDDDWDVEAENEGDRNQIRKFLAMNSNMLEHFLK